MNRDYTIHVLHRQEKFSAINCYMFFICYYIIWDLLLNSVAYDFLLRHIFIKTNMQSYNLHPQLSYSRIPLSRTLKGPDKGSKQ